jgi:membrane-bound lytic murein transglycosylase F
MPGTWSEVSQALNLNASPFNPKANALAASFYMGRLDSQWSSPRPRLERLKLSQASYNAGLGNILKAQKKCGGPLLWVEIEPCLGFAETRDYVILINKHYKTLTQ